MLISTTEHLISYLASDSQFALYVSKTLYNSKDLSVTLPGRVVWLRLLFFIKVVRGELAKEGTKRELWG